MATAESIKEKVCRTCKSPLPMDMFHADATKKDGHKSQCKACFRIYLNDWNAQNRERVNARNRRLYHKSPKRIRNSEEDRKRHKVWRDKNRENVRQTSRNYYSQNTEKIAQQRQVRRKERTEEQRLKDRERGRRGQRIYRAKNPEKARAYTREYQKNYFRKHPEKPRQYHKNYITKYPGIQRVQMARRRGYLAANGCDLTVAQWNLIKSIFKHCCAYCGKKMKRLTQDHITPLSKGGLHTASNIVPACKSCNSSKGIKPAPIMIQPVLGLKF